VLLRTLFLSLDPYMRGRMSQAKSYAKSVEVRRRSSPTTVIVVIHDHEHMRTRTTTMTPATLLSPKIKPRAMRTGRSALLFLRS
jgi:hypothetical protein